MFPLATRLADVFPEAGRQYARCLKKLGYPSAAAAEDVRARRQGLTEEILRVYGPCLDCGLWHLTHRPLTVAQAQALASLLDEERERYHGALAQLRAAVRPYDRYHAMRGRSWEDIAADFARQFALQQQMMDYWLAMHQRETALRLASSTSAAQARAIDAESRQLLAASERASAQNRADGLALAQQYQDAYRARINQEYPLPFYAWPTTRSPGGPKGRISRCLR